jgi:FlaA1/EpsC-like NDP-sugar epimerase
MTRLPKLTPRQILIVLYDLVATAAAIVLTFFIWFEGQPLDERLPGLKFLPVFLAYAAAVYFIFNLHRNKWRFTSIPDLYNIFRAVTVLTVSLLAREEETTDIGVPGIVAIKPVQPSLEAIRAWLAMLEQGLSRNERAVIYNVLRDAVPEFRGAAA